MITRDQLVGLQRLLADTHVLSVYLDGHQSDPAERRAWRRRLDKLADAARQEVASAKPAEVSAFDAANAHIQGVLQAYDGFLPHRGWVGFATATGIEHAQSLPFPTADLVRWDLGPRVAPFARAFKSTRPVVTVLTDARSARVFRFRLGELAEVELLESDSAFDESEGGQMKSAATVSGVRGETAKDSAQRSHQAETQKLVRRVVEVVVEEAGDRGSVVVGGPREAAAAVRAALPDRVRERSTEVSELHVGVSHAEVLSATEKAATELTERRQAAQVEAVIDAARSEGRGSLGWNDVRRALDAGAIDTLYLTRVYLASHPDEAESLVRRTFEQGGIVEELGGQAADRLGSEGEFTAARLRFTAPARID